ncbi:MAG TPA: monofunctional biosynthetic peptidoglycan transglycosylase [Thermoanaerobaculia bacterium]|nr:monofunctional biosynthetic peptidoglycan transglycosylase [Thermoanaerobaculia bacterium]
MEATPSADVPPSEGAGVPEVAPRRRRRLPILAAALLVLGALGLWFLPLHRIVLLAFRAPGSTAFIDARRARLRAETKDDRIARTPVPLSRVSPHLVRAVIAAEDARFYTHHGIDWEAVKEARAYNEKQAGKKRPRLHGASTITQQLAKNLYLSADRSLLRKAREGLIAYTLEAVLSKAKILEHYLSAVEWGERVYGCEAAARKYFGVSAASLSPQQAAWLAAMIPSPRFYLSHPDRHERRAARIARFARGGAPEPDEGDEDETGD